MLVDFGTTFPHLFVLSHPDVVNVSTSEDTSFVPRIFGFKIHPSSTYYMQTEQTRYSSCMLFENSCVIIKMTLPSRNEMIVETNNNDDNDDNDNEDADNNANTGEILNTRTSAPDPGAAVTSSRENVDPNHLQAMS
jgi:hypothetical protein